MENSNFRSQIIAKYKKNVQNYNDNLTYAYKKNKKLKCMYVFIQFFIENLLYLNF